MKELVYSIIKSKAQYNRYCERLEDIVETEASPNEDEVELLSLLIQKYNDEQMELYQLNLSPVELLADLLKDNQMTQAELARKIQSSPQLINDIIQYRREITKSIAIKLGETFKVKYYAFLKPYELRKAS